MHETKAMLLMIYGTRCMLCKKELDYHELDWHHLKPKYASKQAGEEIDNSIQNGSLICRACHKKIHQFKYDELTYYKYTLQIEAYKDSFN